MIPALRDGNYRDYGALAFYNVAATAAASGSDYTPASGGNLNTGGATQRLSLGASNPTGFNPNQYQARVVGATDGTAGGEWFNVGTREVLVGMRPRSPWAPRRCPRLP